LVMRENARDDYHIMRDKVLTLERGRNGNNDSRSSKIQDSAAGNSQQRVIRGALAEVETGQWSPLQGPAIWGRGARYSTPHLEECHTVNDQPEMPSALSTPNRRGASGLVGLKRGRKGGL
jgi:hypothetical protein